MIERINEKLVGSNPYVELYMDDVVFKPMNINGTHCRIKPKNKGSVIILAMNEQGEIAIVKEYRYAIGKEIVSTCAGGIDEDETPLEAAKRELAEEMQLESDNWVYLNEISEQPSLLESTTHLFFAHHCMPLKPYRKAFSQGPDDIEHISQVSWISFETLNQMILNHEIEHAGFLALILKAKLLNLFDIVYLNSKKIN